MTDGETLSVRPYDLLLSLLVNAREIRIQIYYFHCLELEMILSYFERNEQDFLHLVAQSRKVCVYLFSCLHLSSQGYDRKGSPYLSDRSLSTSMRGNRPLPRQLRAQHAAGPDTSWQLSEPGRFCCVRVSPRLCEFERFV